MRNQTWPGESAPHGLACEGREDMTDASDFQAADGPRRIPPTDQELRAQLQELAQFIRELKERSERRQDPEGSEGYRCPLEKDRQHIRQVFARMEQNDVRFQQQNAEIVELRRETQRRLDELEHRWREENGSGGKS
jgi:hypothetical protein